MFARVYTLALPVSAGILRGVAKNVVSTRDLTRLSACVAVFATLRACYISLLF